MSPMVTTRRTFLRVTALAGHASARLRARVVCASPSPGSIHVPISDRR